MRSIAFAVFTPFYFIKAGLYVSLSALWTGLAVISVFLALKMVTKIVGVFPLARFHYMKVKEASYTTLLMATGLTFGTISSLYGLQNGIIDQNQYTILVSVVILSAFVPTLIAQKFFQPTVEMMHAWGRLLPQAHASIKRGGRGRQRRQSKMSKEIKRAALVNVISPISR